MNRNNTSGFPGVYRRKGSDKWRASICVNGKVRNLGTWEADWQAAIAYQEAKAKYHINPEVRANRHA